MKIPHFWAKSASGMTVHNPGTGEPMPYSCWGWSDVSWDAAKAMAEQRTSAIVALVKDGNRPDSYLYSDRPLREEIVEEWKRPDGSVFVAITRNSYGCLVMNTTTIMFVDIDIPESTSEGMFLGLFGKKKPDPRKQKEDEAIARVREMVRMDPKCGVRIYRTRGGLRYLLTHSHTNPAAETTIRAMQVLGADPLYVTLCRVQECFRARLTPKPWRCGLQALHSKYPWIDKEAEAVDRGWIENYSNKSDAYATCSLVEHFGSTTMDQEINRVVQFHDKLTKVGSDLELA